MLPIVDIVIVNWNAGEELRDCLESIRRVDRDGFLVSRVCVIDNASVDNSMKEIEKHGPPILTIYNERNLGLAVACNQGSAGSEADYLLFLNPDTKLLKYSLSIPVNYMEKPENRQAGICGIQLLDGSSNVVRSCARFPTPGRVLAKIFGLDRLVPQLFQSHFMTEWDHNTTREVDQIMGAFFLVRRSLFEALGGFDERFFVYYGDVDFSHRARQKGWTSVYVSTVQAFHKVAGTSEQSKGKRLFYLLRSRILYGYKHFSVWTATCLFVATLFMEPLTRMGWATLRHSGSEIVQTAKGYVLLWRAVLPLFRSARQ